MNLEKYWVTGEYQIKVQNLIHKQMKNRLGMLEALLVYAPIRYIYTNINYFIKTLNVQIM